VFTDLAVQVIKQLVDLVNVFLDAVILAVNLFHGHEIPECPWSTVNKCNPN